MPTSVIARLLFVVFSLSITGSAFAQYRTANFEVYCQQPAFAKQVGDLAEKYRKELAELWLNEELPTWTQRCPITVKFERLAGGETSFAFSPGPDGRSMPFDWRMKLFGSPKRILDSVLPHEVTHTIFATHFGRPLPRWADEGACTTVEHEEERQKNHQMLMEFLTHNRGIPFNHMFAMKQYPRDILPLYAQGHSVAKYLIMQKGHRHFVDFVGAGMDREVRGREPQAWNQITKEFYGYEDLSDLQVRWLSWVKQGSPRLDPTDVAVRPQAQATPQQSYVATIQSPIHSQSDSVNSVAASASFPEGESWYARQSRVGGNSTMHRPDNTGTSHSDTYTPGSINPATYTPAQSKLRARGRETSQTPKTVWR